MPLPDIDCGVPPPGENEMRIDETRDAEIRRAVASSFLSSLPMDSINALLIDASVEHAGARTTVYRAGREADAALLVDGLLLCLMPSEDGRQLSFRQVDPGGVINLSLAEQHVSIFNVYALESSTMLRLSTTHVRRVASHDPAVTGAIVAELERRYAEDLPEAAMMRFDSLIQRIARQILHIMAAHAPQNGQSIAPVSMQELADAVGSKPAVVSRRVNELCARGLLVRVRSGLCVPDPAALLAAADRWTPHRESDTASIAVTAGFGEPAERPSVAAHESTMLQGVALALQG